MAKKIETATAVRGERASTPVPERAIHRDDVECRQALRANPGGTLVRVLRPWQQGMRDKVVALRPDHAKRLLRGGFVEEVSNA